MRARDGSVHVHCTLCDGCSTAAEMAAAACGAGVRHLGFSCHSHTPIPADAGGVLASADMTEYRRTVLDLRRAYAGRMEVLLGIEVDSFADVGPAGFDYWIGSVHYQRSGGGDYYAADWGEEQFAACRDRMFGGDALAVTEGYFAAVAEMAVRRPTILGHIDLITKLNAGDRFFDESAPRYRRSALEALHAADPAATLLEINTGGMARGYRRLPYPAPFLLEEWRRMGGRIILTADAHRADAVVYAYGAAEDLARAAGYTECVVLTAAGPAACPL